MLLHIVQSLKRLRSSNVFYFSLKLPSLLLYTTMKLLLQFIQVLEKVISLQLITQWKFYLWSSVLPADSGILFGASWE